MAQSDKMSNILPKGLATRNNASLLTGILRGAEREALRVTPEAKLACSPHPDGLGSALTHPQITTDFSEALMEFITPPSHHTEDLFIHLETIQKFVATKLRDELLWSSSMPCLLDRDADIPVAHYGRSNNGMMKTNYRLGLGRRYGRSMQTIAGVHYNFSLPNSFWAWLRNKESPLEDLQEFKDRKYFGLIRNFRRYFWLLIYLFGASPATCRSFVSSREHDLLPMAHSDHTLHKPWATSLRMGDLGYQSSAQEDLYVCYNNKQTYIKTLCRAITTPYAEYERIGIKDKLGNYQQLNTSILQIENEFYSAIRPKRTAKPGETALTALCHRGVEYIEVRCLDIDPYSPLGMNRMQTWFLDVFLLYCCLLDSRETDRDESAIVLRNQKSVVNEGRKPNLELNLPQGGSDALASWATSILQEMQPIADLLDQTYRDENKQQQCYQMSLEHQRDKIKDSSRTPSAQLLKELSERKIDYPTLAMELSRAHTDTLLQEKLPAEIIERFETISSLSIKEQLKLEQKSSQPFDEYLANYYRQYNLCCR